VRVRELALGREGKDNLFLFGEILKIDVWSP